MTSLSKWYIGGNGCKGTPGSFSGTLLLFLQQPHRGSIVHGEVLGGWWSFLWLFAPLPRLVLGGCRGLWVPPVLLWFKTGKFVAERSFLILFCVCLLSLQASFGLFPLESRVLKQLSSFFGGTVVVGVPSSFTMIFPDWFGALLAKWPSSMPHLWSCNLDANSILSRFLSCVSAVFDKLGLSPKHGH